MKAIYQIFIIFGVVLGFLACNEEPEYYVLEDQPDEMHVSVNVDTILLLPTIADEEAIHLTWSAIPTTDSVSYLVQLYATGNMNEDYTDYYEMGSVTEFSLTHSELNTIVGHWALAGDPISVTARVVGTVHNELKYIKPEVSTVDFVAIGWELYPTNLYLHTSMNDAVTTLSQQQLGTGVYEATLRFEPCTYHFTQTSYSDYPAYYMDEDGKLLYVAVEGDYQEFENNLPTGTYTILVDVNEDYLDSRIIYIQLPDGGNPYLVGDGCSIGWNLNVAAGYMTLSSDPRTPYIYSWTGQFYATGEYPDDDSSEGTFKVLLFDSYSSSIFFAPYENANPAEEHELPEARLQGNYDYKWLVPENGEFTFTIDLYNMTTSYEPVQ